MVNDAEDKAVIIPVYTNILTYQDMENTAFPDPGRIKKGRASIEQNIF